MEKILEGQTALVTGGSRGIGAAVVDRLAAMGARVAATATTMDGAAHLGTRLGDAGGRGYCLDVCNDEAMDTVLKQVRQDLGSPSILINNAGITRDQLLLRMKDEDWDLVIQTNLRAVYRLSRLCVRDMLKAQYGRIVNITSVVGMMGNAGQSNYAAAKAGVAGFSRALAREVASRRVTVNCVAPGFIETDMTSGLPQDHRESLLHQVPAARLGSPADVAAAVAYLVSPEAGYVTGETLQVNGGLWMG